MVGRMACASAVRPAAPRATGCCHSSASSGLEASGPSSHPAVLQRWGGHLPLPGHRRRMVPIGTRPPGGLGSSSLNPRGRCTSTCSSLLPLHHMLALVPQVCFTQECQQEADKEFLSVIVPGLLLAGALFASLFRPPPSGDKFFQDPDSQIVFEKSGDEDVGRDQKGELMYRVVSYTPFPCEADAEGEQIRIDVGKVGQPQPRTFVFQKTLPAPSQLIKVTLKRPLGIVFEEDARRKRVVVADFVEGGLAEQQKKKAGLDKTMEASTALVGDVLRATTCTTLVYEPASMFGAAAPVPTLGIYSADDQKWPAVATALQRGSVSDGPVTLILERPVAR